MESTETSSVEQTRNSGSEDGGRGRDAASWFEPGQILGDKYRLVRLLGSGGMGSVFEARHVLLDKPVAIKILHAQYGWHPDLIERFVREARAASSIGNAHIVDVTDFGKTDEGLPYSVMELLDGESLADIIDRKPLSWPHAAGLALQLCSALEAAHAAGIVHRDLKPANIIVVGVPQGEGEHVKVLDFGVAKITTLEDERGADKLTIPGTICGTPEYMAPEQAVGEDVDHRADIYALGTLLWEMIVGHPPFTGASPLAIAARQVTEEVPTPRQVRPELRLSHGAQSVIMKALSKDPADRHSSARAMADAIRTQLSANTMGVLAPRAGRRKPTSTSYSMGPSTTPVPRDGSKGRRARGSGAEPSRARQRAGATPGAEHAASATPGERFEGLVVLDPYGEILEERGKVADAEIALARRSLTVGALAGDQLGLGELLGAELNGGNRWLGATWRGDALVVACGGHSASMGDVFDYEAKARADRRRLGVATGRQARLRRPARIDASSSPPRKGEGGG